MDVSFLFSFSFHFFSQLFVRPPQITILPCCISFSWGWFWPLFPARGYKPPFIVLWVLCLSALIPWIYLSLPCTVIRDLIQVIPECLVVFPTYFSLSLNFAIRSSWAEPWSAPGHFCWLYRASPSLAGNNIISLILVLTIWWCPCVESYRLLGGARSLCPKRLPPARVHIGPCYVLHQTLTPGRATEAPLPPQEILQDKQVGLAYIPMELLPLS